jgi:hypothetical protein
VKHHPALDAEVAEHVLVLALHRASGHCNAHAAHEVIQHRRDEQLCGIATSLFYIIFSTSAAATATTGGTMLYAVRDFDWREITARMTRRQEIE